VVFHFSCETAHADSLAEFNLFEGVTRVVDLCAAPGSWSQVLSRVLIKGETFGRRAWQDREAKFRQQMLNVFGTAPASTTFPSSGTESNSPKPTPSPRSDVKIVAIDLQPISPLPGIITLRADITHPATVPLLLQALDPSHHLTNQQASHPVDLVLSDGAPDVTGLHDLDIYVQSQLLFAALNLALCVLRPGGKFVAKIFRGRNVDLLYAQLKIFFDRVYVAKPRSSRASSVEAFIVCIDFRPPAGFNASLEEPLGVGSRVERMVEERRAEIPITAAPCSLQGEDGAWNVDFTRVPGQEDVDGIVDLEVEDLTGDEPGKDVRWIAPFVACGDLAAFDSDASYKLPDNHVSLDPVQPPTAPPYKRAIELKRANGGAYKKVSAKG